MNDLPQNEPSDDDQLLEDARLPAEEQQSVVKQPVPRSRRIWRFAMGFLGWYLAMGLFFLALFPDVNLSSPSADEGLLICSGIIFPIQLLALILFLVIKEVRNVGWGMLSALGVNLMISLVMGFTTNAFCFVPFFTPIN